MTAVTTAPPAQSSLRSVVLRRYEQLQVKHESLKKTRFGFLLRPFILLFGWIVVVVGLITIPFPGPGWATVFVGVGVLSLEVSIFQRLLYWGLSAYETFWVWYSAKPKLWRIGFWTLCLSLGGFISLSVLYGMWSFGWADYMNFLFA